MFKFGEINKTSDLNGENLLNQDAPVFDAKISIEDAESFWNQMFFEPRDISINEILNHD